jgi:hypothetical protein
MSPNAGVVTTASGADAAPRIGGLRDRLAEVVETATTPGRLHHVVTVVAMHTTISRSARLITLGAEHVQSGVT